MQISGVFIPICLYSKSFYFQRRNIYTLLEEYITKYDRALIVLADDLWAYNHIIKGGGRNINDALQIARQRGNELASMVSRCISNRHIATHIEIRRWNEIILNPEFQAVQRVIDRLYSEHDGFRDIVSNFIEFNLSRFNVDEDQEKHYYEMRYIIEEIAMSIYCTEVLGYHTELWEKETDSPDPIKFVYQYLPDKILQISTAHVPKRQLIFLSPKYLEQYSII